MASFPDSAEPRKTPHYLKEWRLKRDLSMLELGRAIGTTKSIVSQWESGKINITMASMLKLLNVLKINANQFFSSPDRPSLDALMSEYDDDKLRDAQRMLEAFLSVSK